MAGKLLKLLGVVVPGVIMALGMVDEYLKEKKQDEKIDEKIDTKVKEYMDAQYIEVEE